MATTITTQKSTARIRHLLRVGGESTLRFLSVEPQWERIDLSEWLPHIDWVIQGGESGPLAHEFHVEWAEDMIAQCGRHGVPYFLKQLGSNPRRGGERLALGHPHGGNWDEWPKSLRVRQVHNSHQRSECC